MPQEVSGEDLYRAVAASSVPVLLDVWAPWCGPCRMMAPVLDAVAKERAGQLIVLKLNSDDQQEASARFGIRGIPTLILFRNGSEYTRQSGAMSKAMLDSWLTGLLVGSSTAQL
jgi:thioredoxin 2